MSLRLSVYVFVDMSVYKECPGRISRLCEFEEKVRSRDSLNENTLNSDDDTGS